MKALVEWLRSRRFCVWTSRLSLFGGMYAITATIIAAETGSVVAGLTLGLVGSVLKTAWATFHGQLFAVTAH